MSRGDARRRAQVWLDKPWTDHVPRLVAEMHGPVKYLFHKPWIVVLSGFWWAEWRSFAASTFVGDEFNPRVLEPLDAPDAYANAERAAPCLAPNATACGAPRSAADEPFPPGEDLDTIRASNCVKAP